MSQTCLYVGTDVREYKIGSVVGGLCARGSQGLIMIIYIYICLIRCSGYYFMFCHVPCYYRFGFDAVNSRVGSSRSPYHLRTGWSRTVGGRGVVIDAGCRVPESSAGAG